MNKAVLSLYSPHIVDGKISKKLTWLVDFFPGKYFSMMGVLVVYYGLSSMSQMAVMELCQMSLLRGPRSFVTRDKFTFPISKLKFPGDSHFQRYIWSPRMSFLDFYKIYLISQNEFTGLLHSQIYIWFPQNEFHGL